MSVCAVTKECITKVIRLEKVFFFSMVGKNWCGREHSLPSMKHTHNLSKMIVKKWKVSFNRTHRENFHFYRISIALFGWLFHKKLKSYIPHSGRKIHRCWLSFHIMSIGIRFYDWPARLARTSTEAWFWQLVEPKCQTRVSGGWYFCFEKTFLQFDTHKKTKKIVGAIDFVAFSCI